MRLTAITYTLAAISACFFVAVFVASCAMLVFSGSLSPYLPYGLLLFYFGNALLMLYITARSKWPIAIAHVQDEPLPLLAILLSGMVVHITHHEMQFSTMIVMVAITTFSTGVILYILGRFHWGNFMRFLPFPVIAGFLASVGWMLTILGARQMLPPHIQDIFTPLAMIHWVPVFTFVGMLFLGMRLIKQPVMLPLLLLAGVILFYGIAFCIGTNIETMRHLDLLFNAAHEASIIETWQAFSWHQIAWPIIFSYLWQIPFIVCVALLGLLSLASSLEMELSGDMDFNHELKTAGIANVLSGCVGGAIGYTGFSMTVFFNRAGITTRIAGCLSVAFFLVLCFNMQWVSFLPRMLLIGLLMYLGIGILKKWIVDVYYKVDKADYFMVWCIFLIMITFGFLVGVIIGLLLSATLFVVNYSRMQVIRYQVPGEEIVTRYQRSLNAQNALKAHRDAIVYIKLQHYLFFGFSRVLLETLNQQLPLPAQQIRYWLFDFTEVSGIDSSLCTTFERMKQRAARAGDIIVFAGCNDAVKQQLLRAGVLDGSPVIQYLAFAEDALAWCQDQCLVSMNVPKHASVPLNTQLTLLLNNEAQAGLILPYFEPLEIPAGQVLCVQGDTSNALYYLENGQLEIYQGTHRLMLIESGNFVGEIAWYLNTLRTASVRAVTDCQLQQLTQASWHDLIAKAPHLGEAVSVMIVKLLADKLTRANLVRHV